MIIADIHEPEELKKVAKNVRNLGFDYWILGSKRHYVVERKSFLDLRESLFERRDRKIKDRVFEQLRRLKTVEEKLNLEGKKAYALLIVEGEIQDLLTPEQWFGFQVKVTELGVGLIFTRSISETVKCLLTLEKRAGKESEFSKIAVEKKLRDIETEKIHVLMTISGIGEKKAMRLISRFGSLEKIFNANERDLKKVVGDKVARHLKQLLEHDSRKFDEKLNLD